MTNPCPICEGEGLLAGWNETTQAHILLCPNCEGTGRCLDPEEFRLRHKEKESEEGEKPAS